MKASKREVASEQIDHAISSFRDGRYASAVTLAGAGEGVLPNDGNLDGALFHLMKALAARRGITENDIVVSLNRVRNWLKHDDVLPPEIDIQEEDVVTMILRAYTKFTSLFGDDAATPLMLEFESWFRGEYQHWLGPRR